MGEIANDMVRGRSCSGCGIYFEKAHEHPVLCTTCRGDWERDIREDESLSPEERKERLNEMPPEAVIPEL